MTDENVVVPSNSLVSELREQAALVDRVYADELMRKAAEEIERLRAERDEYARCLDGSVDCAQEKLRLRDLLSRLEPCINGCRRLNQPAIETSDEPSVIGGKPAPMPTVDDAIAAHVRQIQILCDESGRDPAQWLNDWTAGGCL
jgi:hypothetical protein